MSASVGEQSQAHPPVPWSLSQPSGRVEKDRPPPPIGWQAPGSSECPHRDCTQTRSPHVAGLQGQRLPSPLAGCADSGLSFFYTFFVFGFSPRSSHWLLSFLKCEELLGANLERKALSFSKGGLEGESEWTPHGSSCPPVPRARGSFSQRPDPEDSFQLHSSLTIKVQEKRSHLSV